MDWAVENAGYIGELTRQHLWLSIVPIVLSFAIAVPLGWGANRVRAVRAAMLGLSNVVYPIPSLALFVILPSILGTGILSSTNVLVALTLYGVAIMARSATEAFASVAPSVLDAASASGYAPVGRALRVELPLAGPVLLAGLRVVAVSTVSLVSVGAVIGVSSLGSLFTDGYQRRFVDEIVVGIVGTVVLALLLDLVLVLLGRVAMPWTRAASVRGRA